MKFEKSEHISSKYEQLEDKDLVRFYRQNGDQQAFRELMNRHQSKVYSYIYSMIGSAGLADDIFQETFTKVITKMDDTYNEQG
ncbi:MAG: RNA polymerase sigma factor, partial [Candidatus Halalkalibacterium sp. M3_1C_030]